MADLPKNQLKAALQRGEIQHGIWCTISDPLAVEMLAGCGYDWLLFDTEHSPVDPPRMLPLLQAAAPWPVSAVARPGSNNPVEIKRLLDLGVQTLVIPYVQDADEAAAAAAAVTYPPDGIRGVAGITRATAFGKIPGYHARAREEICLIVQVETLEAVAEIEAITKVPGVDGIFIGPADLAASMGYPGQPSHPDVQLVVLDAIRRISSAGKPPGILTLDSAFHAAAVTAGARFVCADLDLVAMRKGLTRPS